MSKTANNKHIERGSAKRFEFADKSALTSKDLKELKKKSEAALKNKEVDWQTFGSMVMSR